MSENITALHGSVASGNGFELYKHYSEAQAAEFLGMHHVTLKKRRLKGLIGFVKLGERSIGYFGYQIADYLIANITCQKQSNANFKSVNSGSAVEKTVQSGTPVSTTRQPNAHAVSAYAQKTFQSPKKSY